MSNYNTTLQSNNTDLQAILNLINELPEAEDLEPVLQDKTVDPTTSQQTIMADNDYDGLNTVTVNAMPTADQATPSITVDSSGLITATAIQTAGYVDAGSKSATQQLAFQAAKTIKPTTTAQTAVPAGYYTGGAITVEGDTNLVAENIVSGKSIFGVTGTATTGGGGGDTSIEDGLITHQLTSYTNDRVSQVGAYAFYYHTTLASVSFPNATSIGNYAFQFCNGLTSVSFPNAISIGAYTFANCNKLTSVDFPTVTTISSSAFYNCSTLASASFPVVTDIGAYAFCSCSFVSISFPALTSIGMNAFQNCNKLTKISFPTVTTIGTGAFSQCTSLTSADFPIATTTGYSTFYYCSRLTSVSFPVATTIGGCAFYGCSALTSIELPAAKTIGGSAFYYCTKLSTASFPAATSIANSAFQNCSVLKQIYLMGSSICSLAASRAFMYTSITSTAGSIFVPASLVDSYKTATNWTYFSNRIFAFES